jgi:hypothetical protein
MPMHQTTVRFASDLWEALEEEASRSGISVAQYVRDAALARLMYSAARRGDTLFDAGLADGARPDLASAAALPRRELSDSPALWAEGRLARRRARQLRAASGRLRRTAAPTS